MFNSRIWQMYNMIVFSDDNWRIEDAIAAALKWKYIEEWSTRKKN